LEGRGGGVIRRGRGEVIRGGGVNYELRKKFFNS